MNRAALLRALARLLHRGDARLARSGEETFLPQRGFYNDRKQYDTADRPFDDVLTRVRGFPMETPANNSALRDRRGYQAAMTERRRPRDRARDRWNVDNPVIKALPPVGIAGALASLLREER